MMPGAVMPLLLLAWSMCSWSVPAMMVAPGGGGGDPPGGQPPGGWTPPKGGPINVDVVDIEEEDIDPDCDEFGDSFLRWCRGRDGCGKRGYLRKNGCANPLCKKFYMNLDRWAYQQKGKD